MTDPKHLKNYKESIGFDNAKACGTCEFLVYKEGKPFCTEHEFNVALFNLCEKYGPAEVTHPPIEASVRIYSWESEALKDNTMGEVLILSDSVENARHSILVDNVYNLTNDINLEPCVIEKGIPVYKHGGA